MSKKYLVAALLLGLVAFLIPIEHKYDKLFRFYSLTLAPKGIEISKQYDQKIYFYISDIIALLLTAIALFWHRISVKKWFSNPLWILWLCALFSIIASPFFNYPIPYFRLLQLFTPIALFSFLVNSEYNFNRVILYSVVAAALFQSGIAILQYVNQGPLGLRFFGEVKEMTFFISSHGRWLFDQLDNPTTIIRAQGTFPHANVLGGFLFFSILSTYYLAQRHKGWLFTLPIQFFALVLTFSRAAIFAWGLSSFIWFLFLCRTKLKQLIPIVIVMLIPFTIAIGLFYSQLASRGGIVNYNQWVEQSDNVRKTQFKTGIKIIQDHPFFGLGLSQYSERASSYFSKDASHYVKETAPHNIFLFLACEIGLTALFALLSLIFLALLNFFQAPKTEESLLYFSLLLGFLFIGLCDFYPILFQQGKLMFFLILASLVANTKKIVVSSPVYE